MAHRFWCGLTQPSYAPRVELAAVLSQPQPRERAIDGQHQQLAVRKPAVNQRQVRRIGMADDAGWRITMDLFSHLAIGADSNRVFAGDIARVDPPGRAVVTALGQFDVYFANHTVDNPPQRAVKSGDFPPLWGNYRHPQFFSGSRVFLASSG